uniref:Cysteine protease n=1 Tax=Corethrella appendiculata TaxID=1370023 RepID=U5EY72_9DIPT
MNYDVLLNRTGLSRFSQQSPQQQQQHQLPPEEYDIDSQLRKISLKNNATKYNESTQSPSSSSSSYSPARNAEGDELKGKVESKLLTIWNNVKFEWSGKIKPTFSKEQQVWLLGKYYHRKPTPENSMKVSLEYSTNVLADDEIEETATDAINADEQQLYEEENDLEAFKRDFITRLWMTYRREFPTLLDSNFTSDCGWGCMIRSGQMLLAQGLLAHFLGRSWRWNPDINLPNSQEDNIHRKIIRWFGDTASKNSPFSIHTLVNIGKQSGKKPGDWYGPGSVAHLLRQAVKIAAQEIADLDRINVYVAQDCAVYIQDILDECTINKQPTLAPWQQQNSSSSPSASNQQQHHSQSSATSDSDNTNWKSLILLVPLRLGTEKLNPIYSECLKAMFSLENCIGIIGGRPKHSLYFLGNQEDKLIHLDPHYCQDMVDVNQENFPLSSFHCKSPRKMKISKMDPCCCIGFYCATKAEFYKFMDNVKPYLIPRKQQSMSSSLTQFNDIQYPMFVFCRGKSTELQQIELPQKLYYKSTQSNSLSAYEYHHPYHHYRTTSCNSDSRSNARGGATTDIDDDDDDDDTEEFVVL